ncbi:hypothetical protein Nepgr_017603 [Nepenthes gracilis]|uniref:BAG domain-containing protein n=1 Tax=Nepenthes gracilis TaxID=150966 RepID=A0AAD3XSB1_NEPGR|nr:hypothetical protein Nepgr_017603 [Nepenthes gracilis]
MKAARRIRFFSSSSSASSSSFSTSTITISHTFQNDSSTPHHTKQIPIDSPKSPTKISVHLPPDFFSAAAKIQATYRAYAVRRLVKKISAVKSETDRLERLIQRQETVDMLRSDERERIRINELLMRQLLELDSVPGFDATVRDLRRRTSRRIVGLQEVVDGICDERMDGWDQMWSNWDEAIADMEEEVCRSRGGHELERFCAEKLGFRCLQRYRRKKSPPLFPSRRRRKKVYYNAAQLQLESKEEAAPEPCQGLKSLLRLNDQSFGYDEKFYAQVQSHKLCVGVEAMVAAVVIVVHIDEHLFFCICGYAVNMAGYDPVSGLVREGAFQKEE